MENSKIIEKVLVEMIGIYRRVVNVSQRRAVEHLNQGYCYHVATVAQHILKERYQIDVEMYSNAFHAYIRYEKRDYDTLYPCGYALEAGEVWELEEAGCNPKASLLEPGSCACVNPHPYQIAWVEAVCEYYGVTTPDVYIEMLDFFLDDNCRYNKGLYMKGGTYFRKISRARRRARLYRDVALEPYRPDYFVKFRAYPEDLWVEFELVPYHSMLVTKYNDHDFPWFTQLGTWKVSSMESNEPQMIEMHVGKFRGDGSIASRMVDLDISELYPKTRGGFFPGVAMAVDESGNPTDASGLPYGPVVKEVDAEVETSDDETDYRVKVVPELKEVDSDHRVSLAGSPKLSEMLDSIKRGAGSITGDDGNNGGKGPNDPNDTDVETEDGSTSSESDEYPTFHGKMSTGTKFGIAAAVGLGVAGIVGTYFGLREDKTEEEHD